MKKIILFCSVVFALGVLSACHSSNSDCANTMCTADFRMITVELKDSLGNAFVPDKVQTFYNGNLIQESSGPSVPMQNVYTIVDDSHLSTLQLNMNRDVNFKVIKNNVMVKEAGFVVKADCCHVDKVSGPAQLIIP